MKILLIAGTRPNFIKLAPLYHALKRRTDFKTFICHTGQHFDYRMSDIFWDNLELPEPDFQLNVQGDGVVDTIGKTILGINDVLKANHFELVIVFGDVNATVAGAIAAAQSRLKVMHVEAGLRSFDRTMPEEINRILTDHVSDFLVVSEPSGMRNLSREGFDEGQFELVGNIMIESLLRTKDKWEKIELPADLIEAADSRPVVMTFHRPENVDHELNLRRIIVIIKALSKAQKVIFPVHPRTLAKLKQFGLNGVLEKNPSIYLSEPLGYFHFLRIVSKAGLVITDSGGVQEETSFLNVPCITFRKNTERPVTIDLGTNMLLNIWDDLFMEKMQEHILSLSIRPAPQIPLWDENVSKRIVNYIDSHI